jgi:hypothetical protein
LAAFGAAAGGVVALADDADGAVAGAAGPVAGVVVFPAGCAVAGLDAEVRSAEPAAGTTSPDGLATPDAVDEANVDRSAMGVFDDFAAAAPAAVAAAAAADAAAVELRRPSAEATVEVELTPVEDDAAGAFAGTACPPAGV